MPFTLSALRRKRGPRVLPLNLALQGGGAHGAFSWGVLDALLEDGRVVFDGVSGSSAGAMNAAVLAQGLMDGGNEGAREALARFWAAVATSVPDGFDGEGAPPLLCVMSTWTQWLSPEQLNPFDLNPLREILRAQIDFERLRQASPLRLFIAATEARSGRLQLFRNAELSAEVLLASACLPSLFRAVEIAGTPYWDGAYAANPPVLPLLTECQKARDTLLVLLSPLEHKLMPHTAAAIQARAVELGFTAGFRREMQMLALLRRHRSEGALREKLLPDTSLQGRACRARFHMVAAGELFDGLGAETKLAASQRFFDRLKAAGRAQAQAWLKDHAADVGKRSSLDLASAFL